MQKDRKCQEMLLKSNLSNVWFLQLHVVPYKAHPVRRTWAYKCHGVACPQCKMLLLRHFSTDFDWLFHKIGLGGGFKLLHRIVKFTMVIYANLCKIASPSFLDRPCTPNILTKIASSPTFLDRSCLYTKFRNSSCINYQDQNIEFMWVVVFLHVHYTH